MDGILSNTVIDGKNIQQNIFFLNYLLLKKTKRRYCTLSNKKQRRRFFFFCYNFVQIYLRKKIIVDNPDWSKIEFIELKTSKKVFHVNQDKNLKMYKFIKWWAQSFLVNVQQVHCGFRDKYGLVQEIIPFAVKDLPRQSSVCVTFFILINFI